MTKALFTKIGARIGAGAMAAAFTFLATGLATGAMAAPHSEARAPAVREARIPFVQYGGIRDWRTANDREIYIQDSGRHWYKAALMGPCTGLEFANGVRFLPSDSAGTFDRFSTVVVEGQRCKVQSVTQIRGEPDVPNHPRPHDRS